MKRCFILCTVVSFISLASNAIVLSATISFTHIPDYGESTYLTGKVHEITGPGDYKLAV
jgi:hypothetical protein